MKGRKPSLDRQAARVLGLGTPHGIQVVRRLGRARLDMLDPACVALLVRPPSVGNSQSFRKGGIAARGMGQRASNRALLHPRDEIEVEIQRILRERGLIKP